MSTGLILGKFMPPHRGHQYLIDFARGFVDDLTVQVCSIAREPIPGNLRYRWVKEFFGGVRVVHNADENPQQPEDDPAHFWDIWRDSLLKRLPGGKRPDYVFASEPYGIRLAQELGAAFVPVDPKREIMPISATLLRSDPRGYWKYLLPTARPYFVTRVAIVGPESAGKSTLAPALAGLFGARYVPEYGRTFQENIGRDLVLEDMDVIIRGHIAAEDAVALHEERGLIVVDTEAIVSKQWSFVFFDQASEAVEAQCLVDRYHLYLVATPQESWVDDGWRLQPMLADRSRFCNAIREELDKYKRNYVVLQGSWEERERQARDAVEALMASRGPSSEP